MADRGVFVVAFLTVVLIIAGAFAVPEFFVYELLTATIFVVIGVMVFFGDDKFPYMLGIIAPIFWIVFKLLVGELRVDMHTLYRFFAEKPIAPLNTPLHGFSDLTALLLVALSANAWRKQVTEKFIGKTFVGALVVTLIWVGVLAVVGFSPLAYHVYQH